MKPHVKSKGQKYNFVTTYSKKDQLINKIFDKIFYLFFLRITNFRTHIFPSIKINLLQHFDVLI